MKGILAEPGKAPVIASLPDSLWAIENRLGIPCEMIVLPRTPAVLFVGRYDGPIQPASLLNRKYRGRQLYGSILCYGWKGNNISASAASFLSWKPRAAPLHSAGSSWKQSLHI